MLYPYKLFFPVCILLRPLADASAKVLLLLLLLLKTYEQVNASNIKTFVQSFTKYLNRFTILTCPYLKGKDTPTGYKDIHWHPKQTSLPVARSRKLGLPSNAYPFADSDKVTLRKLQSTLCLQEAGHWTLNLTTCSLDWRTVCSVFNIQQQIGVLCPSQLERNAPAFRASHVHFMQTYLIGLESRVA